MPRLQRVRAACACRLVPAWQHAPLAAVSFVHRTLGARNACIGCRLESSGSQAASSAFHQPQRRPGRLAVCRAGRGRVWRRLQQHSRPLRLRGGDRPLRLRRGGLRTPRSRPERCRGACRGQRDHESELRACAVDRGKKRRTRPCDPGAPELHCLRGTPETSFAASASPGGARRARRRSEAGAAPATTSSRARRWAV